METKVEDTQTVTSAFDTAKGPDRHRSEALPVC